MKFLIKKFILVLLTCTCNLWSNFVHYIYLEEFDGNAKQSRLPSRVLLMLSLKLFAEIQKIIKLEPVDTGNAE